MAKRKRGGKGNAQHHQDTDKLEDKGTLQTPSSAMSRKEKRKWERQMQKQRKHAFVQHKKVPSIASLYEKKAEAKKSAEQATQKKEKKRLQRQKKRKARREVCLTLTVLNF